MTATKEVWIEENAETGKPEVRVTPLFDAISPQIERLLATSRSKRPGGGGGSITDGGSV